MKPGQNSMNMHQERTSIIENPEQFQENYKNAQEKTLLPSTFSLAWGLVMVAVGAMYKGIPCVADIPKYLILGGVITLLMTIWKIMTVMVPLKCDFRIPLYTIPIASIVNIIITIWGSYLVFGSYGVWTYEEENIAASSTILSSENNETNFSTAYPYDTFCSYPAFVFSIVTLIIHWILFPFTFVCECLLVSNVFGTLFSICCCGLGRTKHSYYSTGDSNFSI